MLEGELVVEYVGIGVCGRLLNFAPEGFFSREFSGDCALIRFIRNF